MNATILLLVSDPVIRTVIHEVLESAGYTVRATGDIGGAVDRLKESTPDLFMVRHYTQNMSGHEASRYLRKLCPGIPVLIVGGILDDDRLENRELLQGFEIFPKPFKAAELLDKVKEVLRKRPPRT
ncbi:MAG: response regulator [Bryobacteraceae bacterium]|jgi:two-component system response regulator MprA